MGVWNMNISSQTSIGLRQLDVLRAIAVEAQGQGSAWQHGQQRGLLGIRMAKHGTIGLLRPNTSLTGNGRVQPMLATRRQERAQQTSRTTWHPTPGNGKMTVVPADHKEAVGT